MRHMAPGNRWYRRYVVGLAMLALGCGAAIATFNQQAYLNTTSLKAEALALVAKGTEPYADHEEAAKRLMRCPRVATPHDTAGLRSQVVRWQPNECYSAWTGTGSFLLRTCSGSSTHQVHATHRPAADAQSLSDRSLRKSIFEIMSQ